MTIDFSKDYAMQSLQEVRRPGTFERVHHVHESQREASPIYVAQIDSDYRESEASLLMLNATQVATEVVAQIPPVIVLVRPASLGNSASRSSRDREAELELGQ
jgi:hypothetical protein